MSVKNDRPFGVSGIRLLIPVLLLLCTAGCASGGENVDQRVQRVLESINGEPVVPRKANRIYIPMFSETSYIVPGVSRTLTQRVRELIIQDGRLGLVQSIQEADLELIGQVLLYQIQPRSYNEMGLPLVKRMRIVASVRLMDRQRGKVVFFEKDVQAFESYSEIAPPVSSEETVRERVIETLARRITLQAVTGWYTDLMTPVEKVKR